MDANIGARELTFSLWFSIIGWPKLYASVSKFNATCDVCKKIKNSTSLPTGLLHLLPFPTSRSTYWSIGFLTEFPLSQGYNAIFVCIDYLTKYNKFIPCFTGKDLLTGDQFALLCFRVWFFDIFGIPTSSVHDRNPKFTSDFWQSLWKLLGSCDVAISTYHPIAYSQTEYMNYTIGQILCAHLLNKDHAHWPKYLTVTGMTINSKINAITQKSPFKFLYSENIPFFVG